MGIDWGSPVTIFGFVIPVALLVWWWGSKTLLGQRLEAWRLERRWRREVRSLKRERDQTDRNTGRYDSWS